MRVRVYQIKDTESNKENIRDITDIKVRKVYEIMGRFYNGWPLSAEEKAILAEFNIAG